VLDLRIARELVARFGMQCLLLAKDFRVLRANQRFQCFGIEVLEIEKVRALGHRGLQYAQPLFSAQIICC